MFTGIVEQVGVVESVAKSVVESFNGTPADQGLRISIRAHWDSIQAGESIAVNGACLTAEHPGQGTADFFLGAETLERTSLRSLRAGARVNLERALLASARLSGHLVQGHVDGIARLASRQPRGECHELEFELPPTLARYCVEKGSIALDGVSLTLNQVEGCRIRVLLIPFTWQNTHFVDLQAGEPVNVEVDILAKYMEKLCQPYLNPSRP